MSAGLLKPILKPRAAINRDTRFFWDGLKAGKLLIQKCSNCNKLRHPPGPICPHCHSLKWKTVTASGRGKLCSFVKMHHPQLPAFDHPNPIGLIALEEGTRIVGGLINFKTEEIKIGAAVKVVITHCDEELTLALFCPDVTF